MSTSSTEEQIHQYLKDIQRLQNTKQFLLTIYPLYRCIQFYKQYDILFSKQQLSKLRWQFNRCLIEGNFLIQNLDKTYVLMINDIIEMLSIDEIDIDENNRSKQQNEKILNSTKEQVEDKDLSQHYLKEETQEIIKIKLLNNINYATELSLGNIWKFAEIFYQEHKIDQAFNLLQFIQQKQSADDRNTSQKALALNIKKDYDEMLQYYSYFNQTGYQLDKEEDNIKLYYKINEETKQISILIDAIVDISLENFLAIATQIDLFNLYVPFNYETKTLKNVRRNQKVGTAKVYIPLLTDRQVFFKAMAFDRLYTTKSVFMYSKTILKDQVYQQKIGMRISKDSDFVRMEYKFFIVEYIPISKQKARIKLASNADLKLKFLPLFILNKSARIFSFNYFKNIIESNLHFKDSPWEKKVVEKPQLYTFFKKQIDVYFNI